MFIFSNHYKIIKKTDNSLFCYNGADYIILIVIISFNQRFELF